MDDHGHVVSALKAGGAGDDVGYSIAVHEVFVKL
jgi:hypothetical protein